MSAAEFVVILQVEIVSERLVELHPSLGRKIKDKKLKFRLHTSILYGSKKNTINQHVLQYIHYIHGQLI